jgi:hypothetical protein
MVKGRSIGLRVLSMQNDCPINTKSQPPFLRIEKERAGLYCDRPLGDQESRLPYNLMAIGTSHGSLRLAPCCAGQETDGAAHTSGRKQAPLYSSASFRVKGAHAHFGSALRIGRRVGTPIDRTTIVLSGAPLHNAPSLIVRNRTGIDHAQSSEGKRDQRRDGGGRPECHYQV